MYEGEVTELTPEEMETEGGGYGKVRMRTPLNPMLAGFYECAAARLCWAVAGVSLVWS